MNQTILQTSSPVLLSTAYLGPVQYYAKLLDYGCNIDATHKKPVNVVYKKAVSVNPL